MRLSVGERGLILRALRYYINSEHQVAQHALAKARLAAPGKKRQAELDAQRICKEALACVDAAGAVLDRFRVNPQHARKETE